MTCWRALLRLPYGGAKGGVRCNPRALSPGEMERSTRRFTSELLPFIGPQEDIPGPGHGHERADDAWMMQMYSMQPRGAGDRHGQADPDGSVFRHEATGAGVVMVIARACERLGWKLAEQRCIVQGFGKRRRDRGPELVDRGATVVGVLDISGGSTTRPASTSRR